MGLMKHLMLQKVTPIKIKYPFHGQSVWSLPQTLLVYYFWQGVHLAVASTAGSQSFFRIYTVKFSYCFGTQWEQNTIGPFLKT